MVLEAIRAYQLTSSSLRPLSAREPAGPALSKAEGLGREILFSYLLNFSQIAVVTPHIAL